MEIIAKGITTATQRDILSENKVTIYPNPNKGLLNVDYSGDKNEVSAIEIFNQLGQSVYRSGRFEPMIDITNKADGLYIMSIHFNEKIMTYKIMVRK